MKLLHYVEIENFKRYGDRQHIELEHPAVLIGPNNCGKTSVLQAISLWSIGIKTWQKEMVNSKATKNFRKPLNRLNILSVPVPKTRHLWNNLQVSGRELRITVGVDVQGRSHPVTMIFRHHSSDELIYCEPEFDGDPVFESYETACHLDVALLYPMSGISADEAVILPQRVEFLMGRGSTAEVLRNVCLQVYERSYPDWMEITKMMHRLFHVALNSPQINEKGGVELDYWQEGTTGEMDLALAGRGFQQMLLIFAHLHLHKNSVLLIDEPDAHLEILRQQQIYVLLRNIAHKNGCQVVLVTHSEVLLREALDCNLSLILQGKVENLAKKDDIRSSLKHFGAEHYVRAKETGIVLYVEGSTDVDMLRAFARKLEHPVVDSLEDGSRLNVYYLQDNFPEEERDTEAELERVEGGYGLNADAHFHALKRMLPNLRGLALRDSDGKPRRNEDNELGLRKLFWKRYEAENYFITPEVLMKKAWQDFPERDLFEVEAKATLRLLMLELVFDDSNEDLQNYEDATDPTKKTIWRALTANRKLSDFAEEFFRRLAKDTGGRMLCRKGSLHELVDLCDANELNGEVLKKLDALQDLFGENSQPKDALITAA